MTTVLHIVLLEPKSDASPEAVEDMYAGLRQLQHRIPGIESIVCGENTSPEGLGHGYTLGFTVTFVDAAARDNYLPHPDHLAVVPLVQAVAKQVLVFDLPS